MTDEILGVLYNKSIQQFKCFKWMFNWTWKVTFHSETIPNSDWTYCLDLTSRHIVSERGFVVRGLCSPTHKAAIDSHLTWQRWICVSWEQEAHKIQWNVWNSSCSYILRWHWHCNQGKWHYALEYYYNYEKKYFGYMHYINAFMMDKMVDKLMCSIALKNIFKLHSMALFFIYWNILRVPCSFANYHCRLRRHCWSWHRAQKHDKV